jgi:hypothetical protein
VGGSVLLAAPDADATFRSPEEIIAESTAHCRDSGRLTWVVLDWLIRHVGEIDDRALLERTAELGDLSVLGVLCDAARQRNPHPKFDRLIADCVPHPELVHFFHRVARSPLASRLAREDALPLFRRWNYLCSELRYLGEDQRETAVSAVAAGRRFG